jgi:hypothetical protein
MLRRNNVLLLFGTLLLAVAVFLRPDAVSAQPCHPHMHAASEAPPAAPLAEAEATSPALRAPAHGHMTLVSNAFDNAPAVSGEVQLHAAPFVSMADWSCCGAGCKNARCVGGKSMSVATLSVVSVPGGEAPPFAVDAGPLVGRTPQGPRNPPRSFV